MPFNFFKRKSPSDPVKEIWNERGKKYAAEVNKMVALAELQGWESLKMKEPEDQRDDLAPEVYKLLKQANKSDKVSPFREDYPPAHAPFIQFFKEKGQQIGQLLYIEDDTIAFLIGAPYEKRQAYLLAGEQLQTLPRSIRAIGRSKAGNVFGVAYDDKIITSQGWQGERIAAFQRNKTRKLGITELIPFDDGNKLLLISADGIFLVSATEEQLIHPVEYDLEDDNPYRIDMENGTLSHDNQFIVVGDQDSSHRVLNSSGEEIGTIGTPSEYSHFCLFSKDDGQLITNSCHFYNGITIGVNTAKLEGIDIEPYSESDQSCIIDDQMRVYAGVAIRDAYILGDTYGYIKAFDNSGRCLWRHFLGSTITGMAISDDEKILWVGTCAGIVHKLQLGKGHRDEHTIGNGNHYEAFRLILWKNESPLLW